MKRIFSHQIHKQAQELKICYVLTGGVISAAEAAENLQEHN